MINMNEKYEKYENACISVEKSAESLVRNHHTRVLTEKICLEPKRFTSLSLQAQVHRIIVGPLARNGSFDVRNSCCLFHSVGVRSSKFGNEWMKSAHSLKASRRGRSRLCELLA